MFYFHSLYYELLKDIYSLLSQMISSVHSVPGVCLLVDLLVFFFLFNLQGSRSEAPYVYTQEPTTLGQRNQGL